MLKRIIVDCLICSALVAGGKIISNVAEKNPKLKVVKDNIKKTVHGIQRTILDTVAPEH